MIDMQSTARYKEQSGVHVGCGIGCSRPGIIPCNYGKCIEKYSTFTCDCSLSPFDGRYCHKGTWSFYSLHIHSGYKSMENKGLRIRFQKWRVLLFSEFAIVSPWKR